MNTQPTILTAGARIQVSLDDSPVGTGTRRFTVNEVGTRWVTLFYQPQAAAFRVERSSLERNRTLKVVDANARKLVPLIKATVAERQAAGLRVSVGGAKTAIAHLTSGTASKAKAVSRDLTIKAASTADWVRARGTGLVRSLDGKVLVIRKGENGGYIGLMDDEKVAAGDTEDAVKRALLKAHRAATRPAVAETGRSKREIVAELLLRPQGCTTADILEATGWPAVSVPQQARSSGLVLRSEKLKGSPTRYWATRPE